MITQNAVPHWMVARLGARWPEPQPAGRRPGSTCGPADHRRARRPAVSSDLSFLTRFLHTSKCLESRRFLHMPDRTTRRPLGVESGHSLIRQSKPDLTIGPKRCWSCCLMARYGEGCDDRRRVASGAYTACQSHYDCNHTFGSWIHGNGISVLPRVNYCNPRHFDYHHLFVYFYIYGC